MERSRYYDLAKGKAKVPVIIPSPGGNPTNKPRTEERPKTPPPSAIRTERFKDSHWKRPGRGQPK